MGATLGTDIPQSGDGIVSTAWNYWKDVLDGNRNLDGTYTAQGKGAMVSDCASQLIKASGGTMSQADANAQCSSDIGDVLASNNADPSQHGSLGFCDIVSCPNIDWTTILEYAALGIGGLLVLQMILNMR